MIRNIITSLLAMLAVCSTYSQVVMRYGPEIDNGWGDASAVVTPYVTFPATFVSPYKGNSITKIRIGVCSEGTNVYLYIKQKPQENTYIYRQKLDNLKAGWNEITLDTPFAINGNDDIAIGYKASLPNQKVWDTAQKSILMPMLFIITARTNGRQPADLYAYRQLLKAKACRKTKCSLER